MRRRFFCQRYAFFKRKHRLFAGAGGNGDNKPIEHSGGAGNDIDMTIGDGIERPGINRPFLHNNPQCIFGGR